MNPATILAAFGSLAALQRTIRARLELDPIVRADGLKIPEMPTLLGESKKILHNLEIGVWTAVLYLAPASSSGRWNLCPWASKGCTASCLGLYSGHLAMPSGQNAERWKTVLLRRHRALFDAALSVELAALERAGLSRGMQPAARLDGTSDLGTAERFAVQFPGLEFYDYTKSKRRALEQRIGHGLENWNVTFSRSETNHDDALEVLRSGGTAAIVFDTEHVEHFPMSFAGFPVENADAHDYRTIATPGTWQALTLKGTAKEARDAARRSGFAVRPPALEPIRRRIRTRQPEMVTA